LTSAFERNIPVCLQHLGEPEIISQSVWASLIVLWIDLTIWFCTDGGVNPLSALYIIDEMLQRLKFDTDSEEDVRACDWFDLIVGSGHGG
jgi:hypothetical protein